MERPVFFYSKLKDYFPVIIDLELRFDPAGRTRAITPYISAGIAFRTPSPRESSSDSLRYYSQKVGQPIGPTGALGLQMGKVYVEGNWALFGLGEVDEELITILAGFRF